MDQTAYFDTDFFQELVDKFGSSGGPFAQEYAVAMNTGHHVQQLQADLGRSEQGAQGAGGNGVRPSYRPTATPESGRTTRPPSSRTAPECPTLQPLSDKDIADALSAAASVGDDRIQRETTGRTNPKSSTWTHGSSEQRQHWFTVGYQTGDPKQCDTFLRVPRSRVGQSTRVYQGRVEHVTPVVAFCVTTTWPSTAIWHWSWGV